MLVLVTFWQNIRPNLKIMHGSIGRCLHKSTLNCFCQQINNSSQFELQSRVGEGHVRDVDVFDVTPDNRIVSFKSWSATSPACSLPPTPPPQCPQAGLPELWWWSCIADDYAGDDLLSHLLNLLWWEPSTLSSCCPEKLRVTDLVFFRCASISRLYPRQ